MKKFVSFVIVFALMLVFVSSFGATGAQAAPDDDACWGQASAVYAQMGYMGEHSRLQSNPRLGLRNLARYLYDKGVIADDSMQALGAYVADALGLSIEACY